MSRILTTMPDLTEISTAAVSISLLSHIHMPSIAINHFNGSRPCKDHVTPRIIESTKTLSLPKIFIEHIEKNIPKICESLTNWVDYHYQAMFLSSGRKYDLYCIVSDLVWYPNGSINYKQTTLHLQNSPRLSDVQKFRLLCTYCLKEEIEHKWPVLFENDAYDHVNFSEYPLIYYWNSYCKNALDKISVPEGMSLDNYMFQNEKVGNWPAKEYFFDRMNAEEKIRNTISVIEKDHYTYQNEMLEKLNETQLIQLYVERPVEVLASCVLYSSIEDALSKWFQMKELINAEQFTSIIKKLLLERYLICKNSIVVQVWTSASNQLKLSFLNGSNGATLMQLWPLWIKAYGGDSYKILLDTNADVRKAITEKKVFTDHCGYLITSRQIWLLKRLLNLCFVDSRLLNRFKHNHIHQLVSFSKTCQQFIEEGDLDSLEQLFKFGFCKDQEVIQFGISFANGNYFYNLCEKTNMWNGNVSKLKRLWSLLLPRTEDSSLIKLNFAEKMFDADFFRRLIDNCELELVQELINFVSSTTSEFLELKLNFAQTSYFRNICENLISKAKLEKLQTLINIIFDTPEQSEPLRMVLLAAPFSYNTHWKDLVESRSLSKLDLEILMNLATFNDPMAAFSYDPMTKFTETVIFSENTISTLRQFTAADNCMKDVIKLVDGLLVFAENRKMELQRKLFDHPDELVRAFFFKYNQSVCESWMNLWCGDETAVLKCKREISVDTFLEEELMKCVFQSCPKTGRFLHCTLNEDFESSSLDGFLKWCFGSAEEVKEYKLRRIDKYESIVPITVLVWNGCDASYFKKLTDFFFRK